MENIYLTYIELQEFLNSKYRIIEKKDFKKTKTKSIVLSVYELLDFEKSKLLFISQIDKLELPDKEFIPVLRTMYGLPSGILFSRDEPSTKQNKESNYKVDDLTIIYQGLRRSFLYSLVWGVKQLEISQVDNFFSNILSTISESTQNLLNEIVKVLSLQNEIPQIKPSTVSLEDTIEYSQLIWLGKLIGTHLLDGKKMSDTQRNWFQNIFTKEHDIKIAPFLDASSIIIAYQVVMHIYNSDRMDSNSTLDCINSTNYKHSDKKSEIFLYTLFLLGLLNKKADNYFPVAGAAEAFKSLEFNAFKISKTNTFMNLNIDGFSQIQNARLSPIENCVKYYQIKNPDIKGKEWQVYDSTKKLKYPETLLIVKSADIINFLIETGNVISFRNIIEGSLYITDDDVFYSMREFPNIIYFDGETICSRIESWNIKSRIISDITDEKILKLPFFNNLKINKNIVDDLKCNWLLLTRDYIIPNKSLALLGNILNKYTPEKIIVFNFESNPAKTTGELFDTKNYKISKKISFAAIDSKDLRKGEYQAYIERYFKCKNVRIINKPFDGSIWEMVNTGINVLQKTPLHECSIIETRLGDKDHIDYEILVRSFSDVIVYDEDQRYMFMNL